MAKDPVCNMNVDEKTAKHVSDINGNKVYLCSANCKQQFEQNPSKYGYWYKPFVFDVTHPAQIFPHIFF